MHQQSMYERQFDPREIPNDIKKQPLGGRDSFVVDYMRNSISGVGFNITIAELSIGDGSLTKALLESVKGIELTCADISKNRLHYVSEAVGRQFAGAKDKVRFIECNFDTEFHLLNSNSYDIVVALDIMEHVLDVFNFVKNCNRILKPNGRLFIRVPNIAYVKHRLKLLFGALPITASWFGTPDELSAWQDRYGWDGGHLHFFTIPILFKLLKNYGFSVQKCRDPGARFSDIRNFWPTMLYANPLIIAKKELSIDEK